MSKSKIEIMVLFVFDITRSSSYICTTKKDAELIILHWSCNQIKLNLKKPHLWSLH